MFDGFFLCCQGARTSIASIGDNSQHQSSPGSGGSSSKSSSSNISTSGGVSSSSGQTSSSSASSASSSSSSSTSMASTSGSAATPGSLTSATGSSAAHALTSSHSILMPGMEASSGASKSRSKSALISKLSYQPSSVSATPSPPPPLHGHQQQQQQQLPTSHHQPARLVNSAYRSNRPNVNSILHLVGHWLFEAAVTHNKDYVLGQAEAYGTLCKIFASIKSNEHVLPDYLARFYSLIQLGLSSSSSSASSQSLSSTNEYDYDNSGEIVASIVTHAHALFKLDLPGNTLLVAPFLDAIHLLFKLKYVQRDDPLRATKEIVQTTFAIGATHVTLVELKRYAIAILASMLSLPNHYGPVPLSSAELPHATSSSSSPPSQQQQQSQFHSLRSRILEVFLAALTNELDTHNLHMLFGCGRLIVGEWSLDDNLASVASGSSSKKKERSVYCYNQIVSLISAPLKVNPSTLQNHSFALSIFGQFLLCVIFHFKITNAQFQYYMPINFS